MNIKKKSYEIEIRTRSDDTIEFNSINSYVRCKNWFNES